MVCTLLFSLLMTSTVQVEVEAQSIFNLTLPAKTCSPAQKTLPSCHNFDWFSTIQPSPSPISPLRAMVAAATSGIVAAVNFLQASPTPKTTVPTTLSTPWLSKKPNMFALCAPTSVPERNLSLSSLAAPPKQTLTLTMKQSKIQTFDVTRIPRPTATHHNQIQLKHFPHPCQDHHLLFLRGLVLDLGPTSSWDSAEIGSLVVKRFLSDDEEMWYMWYQESSSDNPGADSVGLAISSDGIHWERSGGPVRSSVDVGLVMNCSQDWWAFDTSSIRPGEVVIMSSNKVRASNAVCLLCVR